MFSGYFWVILHALKIRIPRKEAVMPKRVPPLTDIQVNKAKPKERDFKVADGGGLYLLVTTAGVNSGGSSIGLPTRKNSLPLAPTPKSV